MEEDFKEKEEKAREENKQGKPITLGDYKGVFDERLSVGMKALIGIGALILFCIAISLLI